jgi:hypothetical protein
MSTRVSRIRRGYLLAGCAIIVLLGFGGAATAQQTKLPEVVVTAPKEKPKPRRVQAQRVAPAPTTAPVTPAAQLNAKADTFDQARSNLFTTIGTASTTLTQTTINALPGGDNTPVERILLQFPGVSQAPGPTIFGGDVFTYTYRNISIMTAAVNYKFGGL